MTRSKSQRKAVQVDDTDDDTLSTCSTATSSDFASQEVEEDKDDNAVLDGLIDALYEKRAKTREEGLKGLINVLKSKVLTELVDSKNETLIHLCTTSLKKGASVEIALASHVLGLIAVTCGVGDVAHCILTEASEFLIKAAKFSSDSRARIAALEALALACFVGSTNDAATEEVMDVLWQISKRKGSSHPDQAVGISKASPEVRASALSAWAFLLTVIPTARIISHHMSQSSSALLAVLSNDDQVVRIPAGEAVALLFEARSSLRSQHKADMKSKDAAVLCRKNFENRETELVEQIQGLALEAGGKGQSTKKSQRSTFREILAVVEAEDVEVSLKLQHGNSLTLYSWSQIIQLRYLTGILAEGLQKHLQENSLLHEIFDFVPYRGDRKILSANEKRMYLSPNSIANKNRTQIMNRRRSQVHASHVGQFGAEME